MERKKKQAEKYNRLKEFEGSKYSGMKVGASHKWNYDQGEWRERKVSPDEWDVYYETTKRRAAKAPEGSGAPVGTEYNWLIVAHQRVNKEDANSYSTCLDGKKFKVAHKRANKEEWNIAEKAQRKRVIQFLEQIIDDLKQADEDEEVVFSVGEHKRIYGLKHQTKTELYQMASDMEIPNRSKMSREELLEAVQQVLDKQPRQKEEETQKKKEKLADKSKKELYELAEEKQVSGRSGMKREELIGILKKKLSKKELVT